MKKKLVAVLTALMVLTMGVTVSAASPTTSTATPVATQKATVATQDNLVAVTSGTAGATIVGGSDAEVAAANTYVSNLMADVAALGNALGNSKLVSAATNSGQKVTATVVSVVNITNDGITPNANGTYTIKVNVPGVKSGDIIAVTHNNNEVIRPDKVSNGSVTFTTASCSPFAFVKLSVGGVTSSPKTGETMPVALMVMALAVLAFGVSARRYAK